MTYAGILENNWEFLTELRLFHIGSVETSGDNDRNLTGTMVVCG